MVGEIIFSNIFITQLDDLAIVLYRKNYFSFIEDIDNYIDKVYDFLILNIEKPISKKSPKKIKNNGNKFMI